MFYLLSLSLIIFSSSSSSSSYSSRVSSRRRRFHRGRNGREIQSGSERGTGRERCEEETRRPREKRGYSKRRRRRGPSIPEPGLDPRPSPPKSSTAARPQFRFVFSAPLLAPSFFPPPRFSPFFYLSSPPLPFSTFFTGPRRQPTDPPPLPSSSSSSSTSANVPPARSDGRELWEKRRRPARPVTRVTGHDNEPFVKIRLDL